MLSITDIDAMIAPGRYSPRFGWHDNHREADGTADYLPALMQVRSEFERLLEVINSTGVSRSRCLQLGLGHCRASHDVWNAIFDDGAVTIDYGACLIGGEGDLPGADTGSTRALGLASRYARYGMLIIDAGHTYADVERDHRDYAPLVHPGGVIAFHDATHRPQFKELDVWKYLETLPDIQMIVGEVGWGYLLV